MSDVFKDNLVELLYGLDRVTWVEEDNCLTALDPGFLCYKVPVSRVKEIIIFALDRYEEVGRLKRKLGRQKKQLRQYQRKWETVAKMDRVKKPRVIYINTKLPSKAIQEIRDLILPDEKD
jgi:hypothetical protein